MRRPPTEIKTAHESSHGLKGPTWHSTSLPSQNPFSQRPTLPLPPSHSLTPLSAVPHGTLYLYFLIGFVRRCLQFHWIRGGTTDHWHQRGSNVGWWGSWSQLASYQLCGLRFSYVKCGEEYICTSLSIQWLLHNKPLKSIHHWDWCMKIFLVLTNKHYTTWRPPPAPWGTAVNIVECCAVRWGPGTCKTGLKLLCQSLFCCSPEFRANLVYVKVMTHGICSIHLSAQYFLSTSCIPGTIPTLRGVADTNTNKSPGLAGACPPSRGNLSAQLQGFVYFDSKCDEISWTFTPPLGNFRPIYSSFSEQLENVRADLESIVNLTKLIKSFPNCTL